MKALTFIARWLFALFLPLLLLSASIGLAFNSLWLYQAGFEKYGISRVTGLADTELEKAARGLISYFNSGEELIDVVVEKDGQPFTLFNEREVIHLKDVKGLVWLDYRILLVTLLYVLAYGGVNLLWRRPRYWRPLARSVLTGSGLTLGIMLALWLGSLVNFEGLFLQFHLLSFSNDFWQLDPTRDYLIMLFPGGFWFDALLFIALATTGMAVILAGLSWGHLRFNKKS
ncbi:MAG: TIGR01906 family membrane protein [Chloroflexi bacterium]|nr:TIGR01906 family membrane protein [Chloroflexota bacterium]